MLRTIAEHLAEEGHEVDVFTAQPSYGGSDQHAKRAKVESLGAVDVSRAVLLVEQKSQMGRRALNLALFAGQLFAHVVRRRDYDVVMAATTPPIFVALTARIASRSIGANFVYHMQDIYPEVLAANQGTPLGVLHRALRRIDAWTTKRADRVVVLSRDMVDTLSERHPTAHVRVVNNFLPDRSHSDEEVTLGQTRWKDASFQVVFAGNLGNFQGLDAVVDAFHLLQSIETPIHLVLLGSGAAEESLRSQAREMLGETVFFPGRVSQAEAEAVVAASDLALVTLNSGVIGAAFPSKTMTYLSCGTPVLAAVERASELAELLDDNGVGASCELTPAALSEAMSELATSMSISPDAVIAVADSYASPASRLPQWSQVLGELDG